MGEKSYDKTGSYAGYDKNNKERESLDYYSTPICEVENILGTLKINFSNSIILEPSCGAGHMVQGILNYINNCNCKEYKILASDIKDRGSVLNMDAFNLNSLRILKKAGEEYDFLSENYPFTKDIDYIVMNPPYSVFEPFVMKSLEIAKKGLLVLGRLQILEGQKRYDKVFSKTPPSDVYVYVDRISCFKNGEETDKIRAVQAYAWYYWNLENPNYETTELHWIKRKMWRSK